MNMKIVPRQLKGKTVRPKNICIVTCFNKNTYCPSIFAIVYFSVSS